MITGQVHKLHPDQILPGSSLPHLQPSLHTCLHSAPQLPAASVRGQPALQPAPLADFNPPSSAVHSSPVLHQLSHVHAASEQSPAPSRPRLRTPVSNGLSAASTPGPTSMQSAPSVAPASTPQSRGLLMIRTQKSPERKPEITFSPRLCSITSKVNENCSDYIILSLEASPGHSTL